jgi:hypothetical protein
MPDPSFIWDKVKGVRIEADLKISLAALSLDAKLGAIATGASNCKCSSVFSSIYRM